MIPSLRFGYINRLWQASYRSFVTNKTPEVRIPRVTSKQKSEKGGMKEQTSFISSVYSRVTVRLRFWKQDR